MGIRSAVRIERVKCKILSILWKEKYGLATSGIASKYYTLWKEYWNKIGIDSKSNSIKYKTFQLDTLSSTILSHKI